MRWFIDIIDIMERTNERTNERTDGRTDERGAGERHVKRTNNEWQIKRALLNLYLPWRRDGGTHQPGWGVACKVLAMAKTTPQITQKQTLWVSQYDILCKQGPTKMKSTRVLCRAYASADQPNKGVVRRSEWGGACKITATAENHRNYKWNNRRQLPEKM